MPTRPYRICAEPGCGALTRTGRCDAHQVERKKDPEQRKFYGSSRWQTIRALVRKQEPYCALCGTNPTEVVDHVNGQYMDCRRENLRGLCRPCHNSITGQQHRRKQG